MLVDVVLGLLLVIIVFFTVLAIAGNPGGFWIFGTVGVQCLLVGLCIIGIIGIIDMLGGILIVGGATGTGLILIPLLH